MEETSNDDVEISEGSTSVVTSSEPFILRYKRERELENKKNEIEDKKSLRVFWEDLSEEEQRFYESVIQRAEKSKETTEKVLKLNRDENLNKNSDKKIIESENEKITNLQNELKKFDDLTQPQFYSVAKQPKTINYQLSSQRCWLEGWTLKPETKKKEVGSFDDVTNAVKISGDLKVTNYQNGKPFLVVDENGAGNIWYENGNLAATMICESAGSLCYVIFDKVPEGSNDVIGSILFIFQPRHISFAQRDVTTLLMMTSRYGVCYNDSGKRIRAWKWTMTSSDAPLKPFILNLNSFFSLRIFSAEKIFLKFSTKKFEKKFRLQIKADQKQEVMTSQVKDLEKFLIDIKLKIRKLIDGYVRSAVMTSSVEDLQSPHASNMSFKKLKSKQKRL